MNNTNKLVVAILAVCACKKPSSEIDVGVILETEGDDGLYEPDIDVPSAETEGEPDPAFLPAGECILEPKDYVYGYVHQCEGKVHIAYEADGYEGEDYFDFGPGKSNPAYWLEPDNYTNPLVAACCGPFDYENPTSQEKSPYVNNCLFDAAQQICVALPHLFRRQAEKEALADKIALKSLANQLENQVGDCLDNLWGDGPPGPNGSTVNHLDGTTWTPDGINITFTLIETEVLDWTVAGEVMWRTCTGMFDNDDAVIPTAPLKVPGAVTFASASLSSSSTMTGSGPLSASGTVAPSATSSSVSLAYMSDGSLRLNGMYLGTGAWTATINGERVYIDRSSVILRDVMEPSHAGGEYMVVTGAAHFVTTIGFDGEESRIVDMTNDDPVVFRDTSAGEWEFDPFDLSYTEPGVGTWTLSFDGLTFYEPSP